MIYRMIKAGFSHWRLDLAQFWVEFDRATKHFKWEEKYQSLKQGEWRWLKRYADFHEVERAFNPDFDGPPSWHGEFQASTGYATFCFDDYLAWLPSFLSERVKIDKTFVSVEEVEKFMLVETDEKMKRFLNIVLPFAKERSATHDTR